MKWFAAIVLFAGCAAHPKSEAPLPVSKHWAWQNTGYSRSDRPVRQCDLNRTNAVWMPVPLNEDGRESLDHYLNHAYQ